jgi:SRSO17 transposase
VAERAEEASQPPIGSHNSWYASSAGETTLRERARDVSPVVTSFAVSAAHDDTGQPRDGETSVIYRAASKNGRSPSISGSSYGREIAAWSF